jgi:hypothetical protein
MGFAGAAPLMKQTISEVQLSPTQPCTQGNSLPPARPQSSARQPRKLQKLPPKVITSTTPVPPCTADIDPIFRPKSPTPSIHSVDSTKTTSSTNSGDVFTGLSQDTEVSAESMGPAVMMTPLEDLDYNPKLVRVVLDLFDYQRLDWTMIAEPVQRMWGVAMTSGTILTILQQNGRIQRTLWWD